MKGVPRKLLLLLLTGLFAVSFSSCSPQGENETLYTGKYFKDMTYLEYREYMVETFYSLLPHLKAPDELGVTNLSYIFGYTQELENQPFDQIMTNESGSKTMILQSVPVFYGLLKRAAEYELQQGIDNSEVAEKHGKLHAVNAQSVEDIMCILMRKQFPVTHGSADGAEYVDGYYIYDELIDPHQPWIDQGWELQFAMDSFSNIDYEWGKLTNPVISCYPLWYDRKGNVYDLYGKLIATQADPTARADGENGYYRYQESLQDPTSAVSFFEYFHITADIDEQGMVQINAPIIEISIGTGCERKQAG